MYTSSDVRQGGHVWLWLQVITAFWRHWRRRWRRMGAKTIFPFQKTISRCVYRDNSLYSFSSIERTHKMTTSPIRMHSSQKCSTRQQNVCNFDTQDVERSWRSVRAHTIIGNGGTETVGKLPLVRTLSISGSSRVCSRLFTHSSCASHTYTHKRRTQHKPAPRQNRRR